MARRYAELIAAGALIVGVTATACTEGGKPPQANARAQAPAPTGTTYRTPPQTIAAPVVVPASFADGEAAYNAGNYVAAADVFTRYLEERPNNAWGHYMLGLSAWKGGDLEGAEEAFIESLRLDPNHVKSLVNLSRVLLDADRPDEAVDLLARADDLEPSSNAVHRLRGRAYGKQGQIDAAVEAYHQAIDLDERDSWSMNNLGLLLIEHGRAPEALPLLTRAIEIRNDVPSFHNNLGMALEHSGRFRDAAVAYGGALAANAGYEKAARNLARVEHLEDVPDTALAGDVTPTETSGEADVAAEEAVDATASITDAP